MINFLENDDCCRCGACYNACPVHAIKMVEDTDGFFKPQLDADKCINCDKCISVCPSLNAKKKLEDSMQDKKAYEFQRNDIDELKKSASGGVFSVLSEKFAKRGDYVCGCIEDPDMNVRHIVTNDIKLIRKMRGSKYVKSNIYESFKRIEDIISKGRKILFSGTPCEVMSILSYFKDNKYKDNIFTMSIICHGTPSPKIWNLYKKHIQKKNNARLINVSQRFKKDSFNIPFCRYDFDNGKNVDKATYFEDIYCYGFSSNLFLNKSCYRCIYKNNIFNADIIAGDVFKNHFGDKGRFGVSSVIVNTKKGKELFSILKENGEIKEIDIKDIIEQNPFLIKSVPENKKRDKFFLSLNKNKDADIEKKILKYSGKVKFYTKRILYKTGLYYKIKEIL